jgi:hypothetical protein
MCIPVRIYVLYIYNLYVYILDLINTYFIKIIFYEASKHTLYILKIV